jgi:hypothetical protein
MNMRMSEGVPIGRIAELYNPEMFKEHEEVIVFTREEFSRFYNSMQEQINYINRTDLYLEGSEEWKLMGYWPKILEKVYLMDKNVDSILKEEPLQCYLDAVLYTAIGSSNKNLTGSRRKAPVRFKLPI